MPLIIRACEVALIPSSFTHFRKSRRCASDNSFGDNSSFLNSRNCSSFSTSCRYASTELPDSERSSCRNDLYPCMYGFQFILQNKITTLNFHLSLLPEKIPTTGN